MRELTSFLSILAFALVGCTGASDGETMAVDPEADLPPGDVGDFDDSKADLGSIEWRRPEEPTTFVVGESHPASIDYSQCYSVPTEDPMTEIHIVCDPAWSEVEWFRVDPADVEAAIADGRSTLVVRFDSQVEEEEILVRASIHSVDAMGETTRLESRAQLLSGDSISHTFESPAELYVYVGHGRTLAGPWDTGTINFVVTPYFE
jgi:hypothetical protein